MSGKAVRETLATLGVIASLIFVGIEIRNSTTQARAAAYQALGIATAEAFDTWAHDPELAELWNAQPSSLDSADWRRWTLKLTAFARLGETVWLQTEQGLLPADAMDRLGYRGWRSIFQDPLYGCAWPSIRGGVSDSFRGYVEQAGDPAGLDCSLYPIPTR